MIGRIAYWTMVLVLVVFLFSMAYALERMGL